MSLVSRNMCYSVLFESYRLIDPAHDFLASVNWPIGVFLGVLNHQPANKLYKTFSGAHQLQEKGGTTIRARSLITGERAGKVAK